MKNLQLIVEKSEGHFWGWIESKNNFMPTGQGETLGKLIKNVKDAITDYLCHEGKEDKYWSKIDLHNIPLGIKYNLETFFEEFDFIDISVLAATAGLNKTLLEQYKTGTKQATEEEAKKIETAMHKLAKPMASIKLVA